MNCFALFRWRYPSLLATGVLFMMATTQVFAFGPTGHRVVARIAENHLTPEAQAKIQELLKGQKLSEIATWAAEKGATDDSRFWKNASTHWHSVAVPEGEPYRKSLAGRKGDAFVALETFVRVLKSPKTNPSKKAFALKFLTHVIGDLHQPVQPLVDSEGERQLLEVSWMGKESSLSHVWDEGLVDHQRLSFTELADFVDTKNESIIRRYQKKAPIEWVEESLDLRKKIIRSKPESDLDDKYALKYFPVVKTQLRKAGVRLAGVLNEIFGEPKEPGFDVQLEQQAANLGQVRRQQ